MKEIIVTGIKNKELKKAINTIQKAVNGANKSAWLIAEAFNNIVTKESFKDDFGSLAKLAEHIGYGKATISAYSNAYKLALEVAEFAKVNELPMIQDIMSVGQVMEVRRALDVEEMEAQEIYKSCVEVSEMSTKDIRNYFLALGKEEEAEEATEEEAEEATGVRLSEDNMELMAFDISRPVKTTKAKWNKFVKALNALCSEYGFNAEELE